MEEILASIRRIISEDGAPPKDGEAPQPAPADAAPASPPTVAPPPPQPQPSQPQPSQPQPQSAAPQPQASVSAPPLADDDDALLLTEMVTDDGTVVSLAGNEAAIESLDEPALPEAPVLAAAPISIEEGDVAPLVADLEADLEPDIAVSEPEPEPEPVPDPDPEPEPELEIASSPPMFEPEPAAELVEAPALDEFFAEEQEEPVMPDAAKRPEPAEQPAQHLVSESTLSASAAALSQLSRTVRRDKEFPLGGGRMVEDLVREALEPMLKEWLDANLAGIVERMVRQEIERMVRRAEDES